MPVRASLSPLKPSAWCWTVWWRPPSGGLLPLPKTMTAVSLDPRYTEFFTGHVSDTWVYGTRSASPQGESFLSRLTSDQVGIPAELKHINKRRKRNQQGLPQ